MTQEWTNCSVLSFSSDGDPIQALLKKIRQSLFKAIEHGFSGPPFDPAKLANYIGIAVVPSGTVRDARVMLSDAGKFKIEFNPNRPKARINFSIAHEIAHTFFPDCGHTIRNRQMYSVSDDTEWELELLCNLGAAEILMPAGSFRGLKNENISIKNIIDIRKKFDVSTEAVMRRVIHLTDSPVFTFAASLNERENKYKIDYFFGSKSIPFSVNKNMALPEDTIIKSCTAIGYTAEATEKWSDYLPHIRVECVGLPPYPEKSAPRVVGLGWPRGGISPLQFPSLKYLTGNALEPIGEGSKIIAHIINDKSISWGGRGFAKAAANHWPNAYIDFCSWRSSSSSNFQLGNARLYGITEELFLFSMIAQRGYGVSEQPRIRYNALESCLEDLANHAKELNSSVHMPKIGTGYAQGDWDIISEMIGTHLLQKGIATTIYTLPY